MGKITSMFVRKVIHEVDTDINKDALLRSVGIEPGHAGEIYEVTGPRLMTFADIASELSKVTGREIGYIQIPHDAFVSGIADSGAPKEVVWLLDYLFSTVLDGRNAHLTDGVKRALGRPPKDFADYAQDIADTGVWKEVARSVL